MCRVVLVALVACTTPRPPNIRELGAGPCETSELPAPASGPLELDVFVAAYTAAAPEARTALAAKLVTPFVGSDGTVAFVYAGTGNEHDVHAIGDFKLKVFSSVDWDPAGIALAPAAAGLWIARARFHSDARFDYRLVVDGKAGPDPRNPHAIESGVAEGPASELGLGRSGHHAAVIGRGAWMLLRLSAPRADRLTAS